MGSSPGRQTERSKTEVIDITKNYGIGDACPRENCKGVVQHKLTQRAANNKMYKYSICSVCNWHTMNA